MLPPSLPQRLFMGALAILAACLVLQWAMDVIAHIWVELLVCTVVVGAGWAGARLWLARRSSRW